MKIWMVAIAMSAVTGASYADNLCKVNPFSKGDAEQGKIAFDSHCALCHQYSMTGRAPGNAVTIVLVPGNPLLGPMPNTPTMPYWPK